LRIRSFIQFSEYRSDLGSFLFRTLYPSRYLYGRYPQDVKFQKSEYFFWFLDLNIVTENAVGFVLRWNFLNKTQGLTLLSRNLCGTLRISNFKILSILLVSGTYNSYQKCHQICSKVKFVEQNWTKYRFCSISHTRS
jgi:hypothetical protein